MMQFSFELATILTTICHNTEKQPFRNRFLHDFDYSHISLVVSQEGQPLWKVVGHLAILHGKRPMASSNF